MSNLLFISNTSIIILYIINQCIHEYNVQVQSFNKKHRQIHQGKSLVKNLRLRKKTFQIGKKSEFHIFRYLYIYSYNFTGRSELNLEQYSNKYIKEVHICRFPRDCWVHIIYVCSDYPLRTVYNVFINILYIIYLMYNL